jgi:8-oxo-dGTP pyrophosphatase MutT (NUDIX family)
MNKRKVQAVIFYCAPDKTKYFLLLKMNERRGHLWQNVTGGVDKNENFEQAAIREAIEETSLSSENIKSINETTLTFEFIDQWENQVVEKVFLIESKTKWDVKIDPSEHVDFKWIEEGKIDSNSVHYQTNYQALMEAMK